MGFLKFLKKILKRKEVSREPYVEKDTKRDKCQYLQECIENGYVLNCMTSMDEGAHYICGIGSHCKQDFSAIMSAIKDGVGAPEEINRALRYYGIEECEHGLSKQELQILQEKGKS